MEIFKIMGDKPKNQISAAANSQFYDEYWTSMGNKLEFDELQRVWFITDSFIKYTASNKLQILDMGCGRGWMAPYLSPFGSIVGVDFSPEGIKFARENYGSHGSFILADANSHNLGLADNSIFDVLICSEVIEHLHDQKSFLKQLYSFLSPKGYLIFTTPNGNVWSLVNKLNAGQQWKQPIENWISRDKLNILLTESGFEIITHEGCRLSYLIPFRIGLGRLEMFFSRLLRAIGLYSFYSRLISPFALYQLIVARKLT